MNGTHPEQTQEGVIGLVARVSTADAALGVGLLARLDAVAGEHDPAQRLHIQGLSNLLFSKNITVCFSQR